MNKITLDEAVGQTLLATIEIGDGLFLRFPNGVVRLYSNYEGEGVYDYTDKESELDRIDGLDISNLNKLVENGFISEERKTLALESQAVRKAAWELEMRKRKEEDFERLKKELGK